MSRIVFLAACLALVTRNAWLTAQPMNQGGMPAQDSRVTAPLNLAVSQRSAGSPTTPVIPRASATADLVEASGGLTIGGATVFVPWFERSGAHAVGDLSKLVPLSGVPARPLENSCAFNVTYVEQNRGATATPTYVNKISVRFSEESVKGAPVEYVSRGHHLNPGESKSQTVQVYLTDQGSFPYVKNEITLSLDDENAVPESNRINNRTTLVVGGVKCPLFWGRPILVLSFSNPMNGQFTLKNTGTVAAKPSQVIIDCSKPAYKGWWGTCPPVPPAFAGAYADSAYPDKITVKVPPLASGESYVHTLSFWKDLKWASGTYRFSGDIRPGSGDSGADAGHASIDLVVP